MISQPDRIKLLPAADEEGAVPAPVAPAPAAPPPRDDEAAIRRITAKGRLTRADARAVLGLPPEPV